MQIVTRPCVLCAAVNEANSLMLSSLLGFWNIEMRSAQTIDKTLQLAQAEQFDLYLLDTRFPRRGGLELCRQLREFNPQTSVVFYSGGSQNTNLTTEFAVRG